MIAIALTLIPMEASGSLVPPRATFAYRPLKPRRPLLLAPPPDEDEGREKLDRPLGAPNEPPLLGREKPDPPLDEPDDGREKPRVRPCGLSW